MGWLDRVLIVLTLILAALISFCYMAVFNPQAKDYKKDERIVQRCVHMKQMISNLKEFSEGLEMTVALANAEWDDEEEECHVMGFNLDCVSDVLARQCHCMEDEINNIIREIKYT